MQRGAPASRPGSGMNRPPQPRKPLPAAPGQQANRGMRREAPARGGHQAMNPPAVNNIIVAEPLTPQRILKEEDRRRTMKQPITALTQAFDQFQTEKDSQTQPQQGWWENDGNISTKKNEYFEYADANGDIIEPDGTIAVALWDFHGERETDLSFSKGDTIIVIRRYENGWWEGELNGIIGDFPCNFVEADEDEPFTTPEPQIYQAPVSNRFTALQTQPQHSSSPNIGQSMTPQPIITTQPTSNLTLSAPNSPAVSASSSPVVQYQKGLPIKEGFLTKKGHKRRNWKVRYFVLEAKRLSYFASPGDYLAARKPKGIIPLHKSTLIRIAPEMKRSNCFLVSSAEFQLYITAPTGQEMVSWMENLSTSLDTV